MIGFDFGALLAGLLMGAVGGLSILGMTRKKRLQTAAQEARERAARRDEALQAVIDAHVERMQARLDDATRDALLYGIGGTYARVNPADDLARFVRPMIQQILDRAPDDTAGRVTCSYVDYSARFRVEFVFPNHPVQAFEIDHHLAHDLGLHERDMPEVERICGRVYRELLHERHMNMMAPPPRQRGLRAEDLQAVMQTMQALPQVPAYINYDAIRDELLSVTGIAAPAYIRRDANGRIAGIDRAPTVDAREKSIKLLEEWLSPEQLAQFKADGSFKVVGQTTRRCYRIRKDYSYNVDELAGDEVKDNLCFVPAGSLAIGDIMLAQKIALETNEDEALRVANRSSERRDMAYYLDRVALHPIGVGVVRVVEDAGA